MDDNNRCAICGWPLVQAAHLGCVRGNCSMRPLPENFYSPERANEEYGNKLKEPRPPAELPEKPNLLSEEMDAEIEDEAERYTIICNVIEAIWLKKDDKDYYDVDLENLPPLTSPQARKIATFIWELFQN